MARTSRWLVGSSSMSTSQSPMSSRARSTRRRWPPERVPTVAFQSTSSRSPAIMARTRGSPAHSYSGRSPTTARSTVSPSRKSSLWPSMPTDTPRVRMTRPSSTSTSPESTRRSVDLPSPFWPTIPMRAPSSTPRDSPSNTVFVGNSTRTFSQPRRNATKAAFHIGDRAQPQDCRPRSFITSRASTKPRGTLRKSIRYAIDYKPWLFPAAPSPQRNEH